MTSKRQDPWDPQIWLNDNADEALVKNVTVTKSTSKLLQNGDRAGPLHLSLAATIVEPPAKIEKPVEGQIFDWSNHSLRGEAGGRALGMALARNLNVTELNLDFNRLLGYEGLSMAMCDLCQLPALRRLSISYCGLAGSLGGYAIVSAIERSPVLEELDLTSNFQLGAKGISPLGEALPVLAKLRTLTMSDCAIAGEEGGRAIKAILDQFPGLTHLDLSSNPLGPQGLSAMLPRGADTKTAGELAAGFTAIVAVAGGVSSTGLSSISQFNLALCDLEGVEGGKALGRVLEQMPKLSKLLLCANPLGPSGLDAAQRGFMKGRSLVMVDLQECGLITSDASISLLQQENPPLVVIVEKELLGVNAAQRIEAARSASMNGNVPSIPSGPGNGTRMQSRTLTFPSTDIEGSRKFALDGDTLVKMTTKKRCCSRTVTRFFFCDADGLYFMWRSKSKPIAKSQVLISNITALKVLTDRPETVDDLDKPQEFMIETPRMTLTVTASNYEYLRQWITVLEFFRYRSVSNDPAALMAFELQANELFHDYAEERGLLNFTETEKLLGELQVKNCVGLLPEIWSNIDVDGRGTIDILEFLSLYRLLAIKTSLRRKFVKYMKDEKGNMMKRSQSFATSALPRRPSFAMKEVAGSVGTGVAAVRRSNSMWGDVSTLKRKLAERDVLLEPEFASFLSEEQQCSNAAEVASQLLNKLEPPLVVQKAYQLGLTEVGFSTLMCSPDNSLMDPDMAKQHQDMSRPLSQYWIATALCDVTVGIDHILAALQRGVRCLELTVSDGDNGEPRIATSTFASVIMACRDFGFVASPFPLILSLNVRCEYRQKARMANILEEILGDLLLSSSDCADEELISPETGSGKVLILAKGAIVDVLSPYADCNAKEASNGAMVPQTILGHLPKHLGEEVQKMFPDLPNVSAGKVPVSKEDIERYNRCIHLVQGSFQGFDNPPKLSRTVCSFDGKHFLNHLDIYGQDKMCMYHHKCLSRVTLPPEVQTDNWGDGVRKQKCEPFHLWALGAQCVPIDLQARDHRALTYEGRFRMNGGLGYVLKPKPGPPGGNLAPPSVEFSITVLSAHYLPLWNEHHKSNLMCVVSVNGSAEDSAQYETEVGVAKNCISVEWNTRCTFNVIYPKLAILTLQVLNQINGHAILIGQAACPLDAARDGVRWMQLWDCEFSTMEDAGLIVDIHRGTAT